MKLQHKQNRSLIQLWKFTVSACKQYDISQKNTLLGGYALCQEKDVETVGKLQPDTQLRQICITIVMTAQRGVESLRTNTLA